MIRIFSTFILISLTMSIAYAQTSIGGIINSYAAVTNINNADPCDPFISIDDAISFNIGDVIMIIQMQGADIDTSNTSSFGSITALNGAGLYEKNEISDIVGNDVYLVKQFANNYEVAGKVQIVNVPQYESATVDTPIDAAFWDGDKGGVVAFEVENTLTLNEGISANFRGFRGGESDDSSSPCGWTSNYDDYFYPSGSEFGDAKGEGITAFYAGKENGRGPQATGGGGGNDHNSGGGGGSNFGEGGLGGMNLNPAPLQCLGQYPGIGGNAVDSFGNRLFMGGGGGSGDWNDGNGTNGGKGGGIVYIKAATIEGYWKSISATGSKVFPTLAQDGAGGGGAGGTILLDIGTLTFGLNLSVKGGDGGETELLGGAGCMGPGGGGGGGAILTDLVHPQLFIYNNGGAPGTVINSSSSCNGQTVGATAGNMGTLLSYPGTVEGNEIENIAFSSDPVSTLICSSETASFNVTTDITADAYQWQIDDGSGYSNAVGTNYSGGNTSTLDVSNLAPGTYTVQCTVNGGCDDIITSASAILEVSLPAGITQEPVDQSVCENEAFALTVESEGSNVSYQWQVNDGSGFVNITNGPPYNGVNSNLLVIEANANMEGYTYQCVVTNDCPGTDVSETASISIEPLPIPDFSFYSVNDTLFVINNSTGEDTYYWDFGLGEPLEPGAAPYHIYEEGGSYFVTIYSVNDCGTTSVTYPVEISISTGIFNTQIEALDFTISPNPTSGIIYLDMSTETYDEALVRMYDIRGQLIQNQYTSDAILSLDLSNYTAGTYLLQITINGKAFTKKVIKR
jgi:hypothetical protein